MAKATISDLLSNSAKLNPVNTLTCIDCGCNMLKSKFYVDNATKSGYKPRCKSCHKIKYKNNNITIYFNGVKLKRNEYSYISKSQTIILKK